MRSLRTRFALPAALAALALSGALLIVSAPADAAPGRATQPIPALAAPFPQPSIYPPFVDDGRRHVVENVKTSGYLIHEYYSDPSCVDGFCRLLAWEGGVIPPANEWFFEEAQTRHGYVWFRMRNAKSNKCAVPGGWVEGLPSAVVKTCSSGDEFLWRAEPDRIGDWRTVKFVSYTTSDAIRPVYGNIPNEYTVLHDDGYTPNFYWSVSR
ncbi:RICIN domain-containing protein [Nonomuraea sp. GTA35]|uniref:RICIN domain-containing protein n=1 Tax=Nonomuraea sp. GTA35 TaxID=1676746 RepID=UPI0035C23D82